MKRWVIAIVCLLGANVLASVVLAAVANNGDTQVIPGYYDKAVHYDDRIASAKHAADLGWRVHAEIRDGVMSIELRDAAGQLVPDARVSATGYARARASVPLTLELAAGANGRYRAAAPARGWCDFAVVATRGTDRVERRISVEAR